MLAQKVVAGAEIFEYQRHDDEQCLQRAGERVDVLERQPIDANSDLELDSLNRMKVCTILGVCLCTETLFWPTFIRFRESN